MTQIKKCILRGVAFFLALGLCACGKANGKEPPKMGKASEIIEELAPEYTYQAEYLPYREDLQILSQIFHGDVLYGYATLPMEGSDENRSMIVKTDYVNGELSEMQRLITLDSNQDFCQFNVDDWGNVYALMVIYPEFPEDGEIGEEFYENYYKNTKYHLIKHDSQNQVVYDEDITEYLAAYDYFYASFLAVDGRGNCCIAVEGSGIMLFGIDGGYLATIPCEGYVQGLGIAKDGSLYCSRHLEQSGNEWNSVLQRINFEEEKLDDPLQGFPYLNGNNCLLQKGSEDDILFFDQVGLFGYSLEKQEARKIITWMDCNIDGNSVSAVNLMENGNIFVMLYDWNGKGMETAVLKKVATEEIVRRETITVGALYNDSELSRKLVEFNRSNDKYQASMKTYMDMNDWTDTSYDDAVERFMEDLISGNGPDVFDLSDLDVKYLVEKGAIEDLKPYLRKSTVMDQNDLFPSILRGMTVQGILTCVPSGFTLNTISAKTSLVGESMGWTYEDLMAFAKENQGAELFQYCDKEAVLELLLRMGVGSFVDYDKKECRFNSKEFMKLLQFANQFPNEYDYDQKQMILPYLLQNDSVLLMQDYLYGFNDVVLTKAYFGQEVTFVGYPDHDNDNGCILIPNDGYGMSARTENKEGAFVVLESLFQLGSSNEYLSYGFPSSKSKFRELKEKAVNDSLVYDVDGAVVKDGRGNPVYEGGGSFTMTGEFGEEWTYSYRPVEQEEADQLEALVENAKILMQGDDAKLALIVLEEARSYFSGAKSLEEVVNAMCERANRYLAENKR